MQFMLPGLSFGAVRAAPDCVPAGVPEALLWPALPDEPALRLRCCERAGFPASAAVQAHKGAAAARAAAVVQAVAVVQVAAPAAAVAQAVPGSAADIQVQDGEPTPC